jgi:hypothetical protein
MFWKQDTISIVKRLLLLTLVTGLVWPIQPSKALASCSAVKSQILKIEKKIASEINYFKNTAVFGVDEYDNKLAKIDNYLRLEKFSKSKWFKDVWKKGVNNSRCFTTSQRVILKDPAFRSSKTYLQWKVVPIEFEGDSQTIILEFPEIYRSIYEY